MSGHRKKRLGEVLRERKRVKSEDLDQVLLEQQEKGGTSSLLGELLLQRNFVGKEDLVSALEEVTKFRYVDARFATVEKAVLKLVPQQVAERYVVLPLVIEGRRIVAVMAEPQNLKSLDELRFITGMDVVPRLGFRSEIEEAIRKCYAEVEPSEEDIAAIPAKAIPFIDQVDISDMQFFTASSSERNKAAMEEFEAELRNEKTPAVRLVSAILSAAATKKASDIHIEPQPLGTVVRIRVDGVLRELTHIPSELTSFLVSRIKILSDMDISERRVPQDGRFLVQIGKSNLDLRVSTLPTHAGEKVVMRLLDPSASRVGFEKLGLAPDNAAAMAQVLSAPQGMMLVTGPTGSGKSTTLYASLNTLRSPSVNIITVEDPIEYRIEDINQVQVNPKAGLTFAGCLRSMLRQDPNVIMVGEIRDQETAEIALQAAQTGHLVLSTLHTNDSIAAITRLLDLNVPSFLIAASVTAVVAQRLVRKLCACRDMAPMTEDHAQRLLAAGIVDFDSNAYVPVGCTECDNSGYKGRVGIYELLLMDEQIRSAIRAGARDEEIRNLARSGGMRLMQEDSLEKVKQGITTMEEVLRVVPFDNAVTVRCRNCGRALAPAFLFCPYCGAGTRQVAAPIARKRAEGAPA
ncbi:MAG TPA: ATPase, T2SS/T4P/T4SS family [Terriglobales bacterium]|nr:ATPase, T2SS/T4P/T4SS family [Terriglobales bacterium]